MIAGTQNLKRILFPTDLSKNAEYAFEYAAGIADCFGARITMLHVMEKLPPNALLILQAYHGTDGWAEIEKMNEGEVIRTIRNRIDAFCEESKRRFPECAFIVDEVIVETGHPVERILHHASATECDMIVMGARGHGLLKDMFLGSTSERVLRRSVNRYWLSPSMDDCLVSCLVIKLSSRFSEGRDLVTPSNAEISHYVRNDSFIHRTCETRH